MSSWSTGRCFSPYQHDSHFLFEHRENGPGWNSTSTFIAPIVMHMSVIAPSIYLKTDHTMWDEDKAMSSWSTGRCFSPYQHDSHFLFEHRENGPGWNSTSTFIAPIMMHMSVIAPSIYFKTDHTMWDEDKSMSSWSTGRCFSPYQHDSHFLFEHRENGPGWNSTSTFIAPIMMHMSVIAPSIYFKTDHTMWDEDKSMSSWSTGRCFSPYQHDSHFLFEHRENGPGWNSTSTFIAPIMMHMSVIAPSIYFKTDHTMWDEDKSMSSWSTGRCFSPYQHDSHFLFEHRVFLNPTNSQHYVTEDLTSTVYSYSSRY